MVVARPGGRGADGGAGDAAGEDSESSRPPLRGGQVPGLGWGEAQASLTAPWKPPAPTPGPDRSLGSGALTGEEPFLRALSVGGRPFVGILNRRII